MSDAIPIETLEKFAAKIEAEGARMGAYGIRNAIICWQREQSAQSRAEKWSRRLSILTGEYDGGWTFADRIKVMEQFLQELDAERQEQPAKLASKMTLAEANQRIANYYRGQVGDPMLTELLREIIDFVPATCKAASGMKTDEELVGEAVEYALGSYIGNQTVCDWADAWKRLRHHLVKRKVKARIGISGGYYWWGIGDDAGPSVVESHGMLSSDSAKRHLESIMAVVGATVEWEESK